MNPVNRFNFNRGGSRGGPRGGGGGFRYTI